MQIITIPQTPNSKLGLDLDRFGWSIDYEIYYHEPVQAYSVKGY